MSQEVRGYDYFRSEDPIEAARIVVSDEVALLWSQVLERRGFAEFARSAAPQLVRWESEFGWTRTGYGRVRERETSLAIVLNRLLAVPDHWVAFADRYLEALDALHDPQSPTARSRRHSSSNGGDERTRHQVDQLLRCRLRLRRRQDHQDSGRDPPRADAICERVIRTIRRECLDRMLILGGRHLEAVLAEYVEHYNAQRPHRSLNQRALSALGSAPASIDDIHPARVRRTERLGGLIPEYRMVA